MPNMHGKAMRLWSLAVAILVPFLCNPSEGGEHGELRIDFEPEYFKYQNIAKVFTTREKLWLYGMNYDYKTEACVYFVTEGLSDNELNYTYNVLLDGKWKSLPHHATFSKDDGEDHDVKQASRESYNSMRAVKHKDNPDIRDYRLVYEKDGCDVFRVPRKLNVLPELVSVKREALSYLECIANRRRPGQCPQI
ncbi:uncharacterized protein LOC119450777 isoform X2 [Dermacentor silvarum]|uniref:uncharacterized protein LOC119450777 isoform X2 n=1 Tax=Dermacentor silvarum TaxID=543639 RepID=UPI0021013D9F|nr:uncharacterized protein LOC119450777 isoform X2 [Dermacentor silvarum]